MSLVSVYIPTHNRADMLKRAVDSVLKQSYQNLEIIIVDDGSIDETPNVINEYKSIYNNIVSLRNDIPKGACHSRNRAINIANGEFITGLDDDDEFESEHIKTLVENYNNKYSFIASSLKENDGKNIFIRSDGAGEISLDVLLHYNAVGNQVFTKTSYLKEINGFDETLPALQDYDTWVCLVRRFGGGLKLSSATYIWHTGHEQNRISNSNSKRLLGLTLFINKHGNLMTESHNKSMFILRKKIEKTSFSIFDLVKNINSFNCKSAISLYLNLNLSFISNLWKNMKGKLNK
ncbi:glycosyltransferase [Vibrio casei]|uniref:Glycosyltransferase n=1 Tax=Vibrio casei TaxID=673372 RepID=A0A368LG42_9VIBR|nr:glycosyltransferase [Vibrio casei]RCS69124.1 glycosyltransferase [Vibrio casei]SJN37281.1 Glycosyltransferase PglI [Vibrio casei]